MVHFGPEYAFYGAQGDLDDHGSVYRFAATICDDAVAVTRRADQAPSGCIRAEPPRNTGVEAPS